MANNVHQRVPFKAYIFRLYEMMGIPLPKGVNLSPDFLWGYLIRYIYSDLKTELSQIVVEGGDTTMGDKFRSPENGLGIVADSNVYDKTVVVPFVFGDVLKVGSLVLMANKTIVTVTELFDTTYKAETTVLNSTDILYEVTEITNNLTTIGETIVNLENNITNIQNDITNITNEITDIKNEITEVNAVIETINEHITNITNEITEITEEITNIFQSITTIEGEITTINQNITNITNRVETIEEHITTIEGSITTINTQITNLQTTVTNLRSDLDDHVEDKNNPHETTLTQAEAMQGTTELIIKHELFKTSQLEGNRYPTKSEVEFLIAQAIAGGTKFIGQIKYGADTIQTMNTLQTYTSSQNFDLQAGDDCHCYEDDKIYKWSGTAWTVDSSLALTNLGEYLHIVFWFGTYLNGINYPGTATATITCSQAGTQSTPPVWSLIVHTDALLDGQVTDSKIGNRSVSDAASINFTPSSKNLTAWLQQFYSNIKELVNRQPVEFTPTDLDWLTE
jgi:uncharacterized coiled-coil DUF342 family protein